MWKYLSPVLLLLLTSQVVLASDQIREQRFATAVEKQLLVGKGLTLKAGDVDFYAIHTEVMAPALKGAVILLHDREAHPNWPDVIRPLRTGLADRGWETLSLQMPLAGIDSDWQMYEQVIPEANPRIAAAVEFLKQRKIRNIVLLGHSLGGRMAVHYLADAKPPKEINALVIIGMALEPEESPVKTREALAKVEMPVLDLFGSRDLDAVLNSAKHRRAAGRMAKNPAYRQVQMTGADHFFHRLESALVARVYAWIGKAADPAKIPPEEEEEQPPAR
jgi:pimeloyl-ACP methyl ester carboxylesterase